MNGLMAQVDRVERLERDLGEARKRVGHFLRLVRESAELSLRDVAREVGMTPAGLSYIETGRSWKTATVRRVAEFYAEQTPRGLTIGQPDRSSSRIIT